MSIEVLRERAKTLPRSAGVYLFKSAEGRVIYVGKAVDIRNRVRSHLHPAGDAIRQRRMLDEAVDVDVIVTDSPWNVAWYGDRTAVWLPGSLSQFKELERFAAERKTPIKGRPTHPGIRLRRDVHPG